MEFRYPTGASYIGTRVWNTGTLLHPHTNQEFISRWPLSCGHMVDTTSGPPASSAVYCRECTERVQEVP